MILWSVDDFVAYGPDVSKKNKINEFLRFAAGSPNYTTDDGTNIWDEIVEYAVSLASLDRDGAFVRALARDGFIISDEPEDDLFSSNRVRKLRKMLPDVADLPKTEDEVHKLLDKLGFKTAKGHLDQAIDNHGRGNWAAANGELRKVLENVFDEIAARLHKNGAAARTSGQESRNILAIMEPPFLIKEIGEWNRDGKNFFNGVFKRLHGKGGHPGLSDEEDCTFRLHLVILLTRMLLRRAKEFGVTG